MNVVASTDDLWCQVGFDLDAWASGAAKAGPLLAVASLATLIFVPISGEGMAALPTTFIVGAVALGSASALIQYVMNWAQQRIAATKASLIYAGEPIWAGVIGKIAGDSIPGLAVLGAALIIGASIISE